jgi:phosphoribosylglycinamide formyltransferase-1
LPEFPGASPVADALAAGAAETGATVHLVDNGVDSGPILAQERVPIEADDTLETLWPRVKSVEHRLLARTVKELCEF